MVYAQERGCSGSARGSTGPPPAPTYARRPPLSKPTCRGTLTLTLAQTLTLTLALTLTLLTYSLLQVRDGRDARLSLRRASDVRAATLSYTQLHPSTTIRHPHPHL